jgi:hypothetical protein
MTAQNVTGMLYTTGPKGRLSIPLLTSVTDDEDKFEVKTDSNFTVSSMSIGIYGERQTIQSGWVSAKTGIVAAAIYNNGIVRAVVPITSRTSKVAGCSDMVIMNKIVLNPGDTLNVLVYA